MLIKILKNDQKKKKIRTKFDRKKNNLKGCFKTLHGHAHK
jgi:hypothetical protein